MLGNISCLVIYFVSLFFFLMDLFFISTCEEISFAFEK
jgi:hypothetical protein